MLLEAESLEFGEFLLDLKEKALLRNGERLPINPKTFQLLLLLLENHGHLVEKERLMEELWADSFVEEANLAFTVSLLRKALGDDAKNPRFIETVPRRGYRFIADVREAELKKDRRGLKEVVFAPQPESDPHFFPVRGHNAPRNSPAAVVAIADWQQSADDKFSATTDRPSSTVAKLELVRPASQRRRKVTKFFAFAGIVFAIGLAGLGYVAYRSTGPGEKLAGLRTADFKRLTSNGMTKSAAVSPDGRFIAYTVSEENGDSLWLKNTAAGGDVQILSPAEADGINGLTFFPDGDHVSYTTRGTLYRLPVLGGVPKPVLQKSGAGRITFSPDGQRIAFIRHSPSNEASIVIANADGSDEQSLASSKRPDIFIGSPAWSPDGSVIAATASTAEGRNKIVVARVSDGFVSTVPSPAWSLISQIEWQRDGRGLLVTATEGRSSISYQIRSLSYPDGEAENITNDLNSYQSIGLTSAGDGFVAVRVEQVAHIWTMPADDSSQAIQLTRGIDSYDGIYGLNYLPDGTISYETVPRNGNGEVWKRETNGNLRQLSDAGGSMCQSPDGRYLIFQHSEPGSGGNGLFKLHLFNGERVRLTTGADVWPTFSPDGRWIVFTRWSDQVALWKVMTEGGESVKLTNISGAPTAPAISPDGGTVAFLWNKNDRRLRPEIGLVPVGGGEVVKTFAVDFGITRGDGKRGLQWAPDGQSIFYVANDQGMSNIWSQPVDGGAPVQVTSFTSGRIFNFAFSPDGKNLAVSRGTYDRDIVLIGGVQ